MPKCRSCNLWSLLPEVMDPYCLGSQPYGQSSSSQEIDNRCTVKFVFLFGSQVMLNQDESNIVGHPLWIWSVVWLEQTFQTFCDVRSFLGATVAKLLSHRWVQEIICGSLCSVPLQLPAIMSDQQQGWDTNQTINTKPWRKPWQPSIMLIFDID